MSDREAQIEAICQEALQRDPSLRSSFLAAACAGDEWLRREIESLLAQAPRSERFLETPAAWPLGAGGVAGPALSPGERLGSYTIVSSLGAGGMGEVYRARDTKLGREIAIKVLPVAFTADPDRLARLEREARLLAALNHPNVGTIYGLEDVDGVRALILELVEGQTLAERLATGALSPTEALTVARQVADALDAAHEKGIVHRDLKPANIKITPARVVKVLDFGIAKIAGVRPAIAAELSIDERCTGAGVVLGTASYMSPEQARGLAVDKRTDIWAFGCLVYEMLTGQAAFPGTTPADTLAAVLQRDPDWNALPPHADGIAGLVLKRCLEKDPRARVRDIGDVRLMLDEVSSPTNRAPFMRFGVRRWSAVRVAAVAMVCLLTGLMYRWRPQPSREPITRFTLRTAAPLSMSTATTVPGVAITPDGSRVLYVANGGKQLVSRALDSLDPTVIATGDSLSDPFSSPDGQWVGYMDRSANEGAIAQAEALLKRVAVRGGPATTITHVNGLPRGATWLPDDTIVFATNDGRQGLQRVAASGGVPAPLTEPKAANNEIAHRWPRRSTDGAAVFFTIVPREGGPDASRIAVYDLRSQASKELLNGGSDASPVGRSHLVYLSSGQLWAVAFDARRRTTVGLPTQLPQGVLSTSRGRGVFAVGSNGTLVYAAAPSHQLPDTRSLVWVDRHGGEEALASSRDYLQPRLSHDGARVAAPIEFNPGTLNIGVWDLARKALTRVTATPTFDVSPVWTPDDQWVIFGSSRGETVPNLWRQHADGSGEPERLTVSALRQAPTSITPDGTHLVFVQYETATNVDIMQLAMGESRAVSPLVQTPFAEQNPVIAPNGRWLAYDSNRSGRPEVYVQEYPTRTNRRWQISSDGGAYPAWARSSRELFFQSLDNTLMSVRVQSADASWSAGLPRRILELKGFFTASSNLGRQYEVSPDGTRFIVIKPPKAYGTEVDLTVVLHWDQELRDRLPVP